MEAFRHIGGRQPSLNNIWKINAREWQPEEHAIMKKAGGIPSGPPAERAIKFIDYTIHYK